MCWLGLQSKLIWCNREKQHCCLDVLIKTLIYSNATGKNFLRLENACGRIVAFQKPSFTLRPEGIARKTLLSIRKMEISSRTANRSVKKIHLRLSNKTKLLDKYRLNKCKIIVTHKHKPGSLIVSQTTCGNNGNIRGQSGAALQRNWQLNQLPTIHV